MICISIFHGFQDHDHVVWLNHSDRASPTSTLMTIPVTGRPRDTSPCRCQPLPLLVRQSSVPEDRLQHTQQEPADRVGTQVQELCAIQNLDFGFIGLALDGDARFEASMRSPVPSDLRFYLRAREHCASPCTSRTRPCCDPLQLVRRFHRTNFYIRAKCGHRGGCDYRLNVGRDPL